MRADGISASTAGIFSCVRVFGDVASGLGIEGAGPKAVQFELLGQDGAFDGLDDEGVAMIGGGLQDVAGGAGDGDDHFYGVNSGDGFAIVDDLKQRVG